MSKHDIIKVAAVTGDDRWLGLQVAYGFVFNLWFGRLRFNLYFQPERGNAFHDHPWSFTTLPLRPYVEDVFDPQTGRRFRQVVPALRRSRRPATHVHRVLGLWSGQGTEFCAGWVPTLMWRSPVVREWNYWRLDGKRPHAFPWRKYLNMMESKPEALNGSH